MQNGANEESVRSGRAIVLHASFTRSPRFMANLYQNAMAMVRAMGKPDLFITFTTNPDWPEIRNNIAPYHKVNFRPDMVLCVLYGKLKALMEDILKNYIFGKVKYNNYTINI